MHLLPHATRRRRLLDRSTALPKTAHRSHRIWPPPHPTTKPVITLANWQRLDIGETHAAEPGRRVRRIHDRAAVGIRRDGRGLPGPTSAAAPPRRPQGATRKPDRGPQYRQRFSREADLAAELWHPHIVGIHDRGEFEGQLWLSMDYVEGTDAAELLRRRYPSGMPKDEAFEIVTAVADALDYAHLRGLLTETSSPPISW